MLSSVILSLLAFCVSRALEPTDIAPVKISVFLTASVGAADCFNDDEPALKKCYLDNGLTPPGSGSSSDAGAAMAEVENLEEYCQNLDGFKKAYACEGKFNYDCVTALGDYGKYVPSVDKADEYVERACRNLTFWKQTCVVQHFDDIVNCAQKKLDSAKPQSFAEAVCVGLDFALECTASSVAPCGCASAQLIIDILRGPAYPEGCGTSDFKAIRCDPEDPLKFINSANSFGGSFWFLNVAGFVWASMAVKCMF